MNPTILILNLKNTHNQMPNAIMGLILFSLIMMNVFDLYIAVKSTAYPFLSLSFIFFNTGITISADHEWFNAFLTKQ